MVAFIGNTLRGKVSGENFDESIASRQNSSDFSPVKILRYTVSAVTVSSHQRSTVHSILKFVFLEIQNKAIRLVLSGPVTYIRSYVHMFYLYMIIAMSDRD